MRRPCKPSLPPTAAVLQEDEQRVSQLFLEADTAGIAVRQRSLTSQELQEVAMTGACLVIALVDKRKLDALMLLRRPTQPLPQQQQQQQQLNLSAKTTAASPLSASGTDIEGGPGDDSSPSPLDCTYPLAGELSKASEATASVVLPAAAVPSGEEYTGHYVLIIGFDAARGEFLVRDPATPVAELRVGAEVLDLAR